MSADERRGSYFLVALQGDQRRIPLAPQGPLLVGRGAHNHLVLNDYRISRQHARVAPERDGFVVYDLNSANGTFVNGAPVRRQQLEPGNVVAFGPLAFRLELQAHAAGAPAHAPPAWRRSESQTMFDRVVAPSSSHIPIDRGRKTIAPPTDERAAPTYEDRTFSAVDEAAPTGAYAAVDAADFESSVAPVDLNQLEDAYEKLGILYAFMQAISKTLDRTELFSLVSAQIREIFPQARGVSIYLRSAPQATERFVHVEVASSPDARPLPEHIASKILFDRQPTFGTLAQGLPGGPTMYAPMIDRGEILGVIVVTADAAEERGFSPADLKLLAGMTTSTAIILQNARMHEQSLMRERLNRDLELAAQIQKSFLPGEIYAPGYDFRATYNAAYAVGGDFYDTFWIDDERIAVFVGDISGKGVSAALLMARISGELRVAALAQVEPTAVFSTLNKALIGRNQPELFFTAVYFTLHVYTGHVTLASAGHPPPYLCRPDGTVRAITEGASRAIGMLDDAEFESTRLVLEPGDSLVLYTDGIVEAADADGRQYGDARLEVALARAGSQPEAISSNVLRSISQFRGNAAANDDLTLVVCHRRDFVTW